MISDDTLIILIGTVPVVTFFIGAIIGSLITLKAVKEGRIKP